MKNTHEISRRELLMLGAGAATAGVVNPGFAVGQQLRQHGPQRIPIANGA
jgi:hypothetical protein